MRRALNATGGEIMKCVVCGTTHDMCAPGSMLRHLCHSCLREAIRASDQIELTIRKFKERYGLPTFVIKEFAQAELDGEGAA
jgi:hypothetical protein